MFLDTSGLLCLLNELEPQHQVAQSLFAKAHTYLVHDHVLSELVALAQVRRVAREATLGLIEDLVNTPQVTTVFVERELFDEAVQLLNARTDKTYSLCDAISFVLMRAEGIHKALTTDHHFEQEGFLRLLKP